MWLFQGFPSPFITGLQSRVWSIPVYGRMLLVWDCQIHPCVYCWESVKFRENWSREASLKMRHLYRIHVSHPYNLYLYKTKAYDNRKGMCRNREPKQGLPSKRKTWRFSISIQAISRDPFGGESWEHHFLPPGARLCGSYPQSLGREARRWVGEDKWDPTIYEMPWSLAFVNEWRTKIKTHAIQDTCRVLFWDFFLASGTLGVQRPVKANEKKGGHGPWRYLRLLCLERDLFSFIY